MKAAKTEDGSKNSRNCSKILKNLQLKKCISSRISDNKAGVF
jgi:hypothetical protein